jgi:ankyrin repeat protein
MPSPSATHVDAAEVHIAAAAGDIDTLAEIAVKNERLLHQRDRNGWQPIHEAAHSGHEDVMALLVSNGVDYNARTHNGQGSTPLNIAINSVSEKHPVSQYLLSLGALDIGPDL